MDDERRKKLIEQLNQVLEERGTKQLREEAEMEDALMQEHPYLNDIFQKILPAALFAQDQPLENLQQSREMMAKIDVKRISDNEEKQLVKVLNRCLNKRNFFSKKNLARFERTINHYNARRESTLKELGREDVSFSEHPGHFLKVQLDHNLFQDGMKAPSVNQESLGYKDIDDKHLDFHNYAIPYAEDGKSAAQRQAEFLYQRLLNQALLNGRKVAIIYSANNDQAKALHDGHMRDSVPNIHGSNQAQVFKHLSKLIQANKKQHAIHILPIATSKHGGNDEIRGNQVDDDMLKRDLHAVYEHLENGFDVIAMQEPTVSGTKRFAIGGGSSRAFMGTNFIDDDLTGHSNQALSKSAYVHEALNLFAEAYPLNAMDSQIEKKQTLINALSTPYQTLNTQLNAILLYDIKKPALSQWRDNLFAAQTLAKIELASLGKFSFARRNRGKLLKAIIQADPNNTTSLRKLSNTLHRSEQNSELLFSRETIQNYKQHAKHMPISKRQKVKEAVKNVLGPKQDSDGHKPK